MGLHEQKHWWRPFACHLWRAFFALQRIDPANWTPRDRRKVEICQPVFDALTTTEQRVTREYFSTRWKHDLVALDEISEQTGLPINDISLIIVQAQREIIRSFGLL